MIDLSKRAPDDATYAQMAGVIVEDDEVVLTNSPIVVSENQWRTINHACHPNKPMILGFRPIIIGMGSSCE